MLVKVGLIDHMITNLVSLKSSITLSEGQSKSMMAMNIALKDVHISTDNLLLKFKPSITKVNGNYVHNDSMNQTLHVEKIKDRIKVWESSFLFLIGFEYKDAIHSSIKRCKDYFSYLK